MKLMVDKGELRLAINRVIDAMEGEWIERPKGKWIDMNTPTSSYMPRYKCSICNDWANKSNFCPNCGADMRGEADDE